MEQPYKLTEFFNNCKKYSHYQNINECPFEIGKWKINKKETIPYSKWIIKNGNIPSLKCAIDLPYKEMFAEASNHLEDYVKHREDDNTGWSSYALHGQGAIYTQPANCYPENNSPYDWTEIADSCPITVEWLKDTWPFEKFQRVRFMLLEPNGYIMPHRDFKVRELSAFNVALNNPTGVEFAMEDAGIVPFKEGEARAIDVGRYHAVVNNSNENRIHMIIHGCWDNTFRDMINQSFDNLRKELL